MPTASEGSKAPAESIIIVLRRNRVAFGRQSSFLRLFLLVLLLLLDHRASDCWVLDAPYSSRTFHHSSRPTAMMTKQGNGGDDENETKDVLPKSLSFREVGPTDLETCAAMERASYPADEAASKSTLQYRQHQAAKYFRCATVSVGEEEDEAVIGFICSTRCLEFQAESMTQHSASGPLLAIHSVVVREDYRRRAIATAMLQDYIQTIEQQEAAAFPTPSEPGSSTAGSTTIAPTTLRRSTSNSSLVDVSSNNTSPPIEKIVLLAKKNLLTFYIHAGGFSVIRPSPIVHGNDVWYELEHQLPPKVIATTNPPCFVVDAFSDPQKRGTGNPAAVVLLSDTTLPSCTTADTVNLAPETARWMQTVAQEFNLAETAFVWPATPSPNDDPDEVHYYIRYFTPTMEVNLCGHATLAAASILYQSFGDKKSTTVPENSTIVFHARQDLLRANLAPSTMTTTTTTAAASSSSTNNRPLPIRIAMEFPSKPAMEITNDDDIAAIKTMLTAAFDIALHPQHEEDDYSEDEGDELSNIRYLGLSPDIGDLLVELTPACFQQVGGKPQVPTSIPSDEQNNESMQRRPIRYNELLQWDGYSRGVILCCTAAWKQESNGDKSDNKDRDSSNENSKSPQADFQSRFFAPKAGINEDPVTGSAHCILAPHFFQRLKSTTTTTKSTLMGHQQSPRGGFVECSMISSSDKEEDPSNSNDDGAEDSAFPSNEATEEEDRVRITGTTVVTMVGELY